jgi:hypothetical protein
VSPDADNRAQIARALRDAAVEDRRAGEAAEVAARHEVAVVSCPVALVRHHERMAHTHRASQARHRTTAQLFRAYARRLSRADGSTDQLATSSIVTAIGGLVGVRSVALIFGAAGSRAIGVLASDATARAAGDWEYVLGEGPAYESAVHGPVRVGPRELQARWPSYGPAVHDLGVRSVAAVPLRTARSRVGCLVAYTSHRDRQVHDLTRLDAVGDAFVQVLTGDPEDRVASDLPGLILTGLDHRPVVHRAAGIIAETCGCSTDDALARLCARTFADGTGLTTLAEQIVDGNADQMLLD